MVNKIAHTAISSWPAGVYSVSDALVAELLDDCEVRARDLGKLFFLMRLVKLTG